VWATSRTDDVRDGLDLDEHPRVEERLHLDHRRHRRVFAEALAVGSADLLGAADVRHEHPRLDDLFEPRAGLRQRPLDAIDHDVHLPAGVAR